ncbi:hypothetical protein [Parafrankia sp. EUN1f]|uniref:hypothetical protein n=1 Tax=Parafrankia sp. EUN1f TaxID=102897 RepID=UPI0001C46CD0|nr:hypothetical protein [Parafrankia sp. EUN1f]EFC80257.1 hypothetical protein FrEUN1fDRAFT_6621 [Parafrankia sp. EUN1f]
MADLVLDYALLHDLAGSMRNLRGQIETDVNAVSGRSVVGSHGEVGSEAVGNSKLYAALSAFYSACHKPFKDSMDKLKELGDLLDSVAKAFFDVDADFAGKVNTGRLQAQIGQWQAEQAAWEHYEETKDKVVTFQYYDENGVLQTATIPLWGPDRPPPTKPGPMPTSLPGPDGSTQTDAQVNEDGLITSETSTVTTPNGLSYTETTTYSYIDRDGDGKPDIVDYTTTITHSDGTTETIVRKTNPDDTYVVTSTTDDGVTTTTVIPGENDGYQSITIDPDGVATNITVTVNPDGTGTKTEIGPDGIDVYTGNPATGQWTLESHTDPEEYTFTPPFPLDI